MAAKNKKRDKKKKGPSQPPRKLQPEKAEAMYGEAATAFQRGDFAGAESATKKALTYDPGHPGALHLTAIFHHRRGETEAGLKLVKRALAAKPNSHFYHNTRGNLMVQAERWDEAEAAYEQALGFAPDFADGHANLGFVLLRTGRLDACKTRLEKALGYQREHVDALNHYGRYHCEIGDHEGARKVFERALQVAPNNALVHNNLGLTAVALGQPKQAETYYQRALALQPMAEIHNNYGICLRDLKRWDDAVAQFQQSLSIDPSYVRAHANLGDLLQDQGDWRAARAAYQSAYDQSGSGAYLFKLATVLPVIAADTAEIEQAHAATAQALTAMAGMDLRIDNPQENLNRTLFFLAYGGRPVRDLQTQAAQVLRRCCPALSFRAEHVPQAPTRADGRIAVGFISRFLRNHTIGRLYQHLICNLPRDRFHVTAFVPDQSDDHIIAALRAACDACIAIPAHLNRARDLVAASRCDVLFYLDIGMDITTYLLAFMRLAPIQMATIGHPVTSGIETIDYFLSSRGMEPDNAAAFYSEELLLSEVPAMTVAAPAYQPKSRADFGLAPERRYYVCPQSLFKFHPDFDGVLHALLTADPEAELLLIEGSYPSWRSLLAARFERVLGPLAARVRWLPRLSQEDFVSLIQVADVMLDPHHFGGGMTSYEALAVGTPVVTRPGAMMCGRVTDALYRRIGLEGLTVSDDAAYVATATALAQDPAARARIVAEMTRRKDAAFLDEGAVTETAALLAEVVARGPRPREAW